MKYTKMIAQQRNSAGAGVPVKPGFGLMGWGGRVGESVGHGFSHDGAKRTPGRSEAESWVG